MGRRGGGETKCTNKRTHVGLNAFNTTHVYKGTGLILKDSLWEHICLGIFEMNYGIDCGVNRNKLFR